MNAVLHHILYVVIAWGGAWLAVSIVVGLLFGKFIKVGSGE